MVRALYILLGKLAYFITLPALFLISLIAPPRVKVIITNEKGEILLVRNWYGRQRWQLPGGGVNRHEPPIEAARRELREELGLDLPEQALYPVGKLEKYDQATPYQANLFSMDIPADIPVFRHPLELIDHRWVCPSELPPKTHSSVNRVLRLWRE